ncbi:hypothetical protein G4228_020090 [Cervus hanglu yarkandensis]|uniref:Uncharacterized protein n=1 Tax=Cervus hanglu yarkandensis TaxID=84702 RepID=A0A833SED1_9CERV|nr:hypothetical protein G4228_020090 [Cervus hanglu yarkandensis]
MALSSLLWVFLAFTFSGSSVAQKVIQDQPDISSRVEESVTLNCRYETRTVIDAKTTQPSSMDCPEGEDVNLPCNHSTIGGNDIGIGKIPIRVHSMSFMAYEAQ